MTNLSTILSKLGFMRVSEHREIVERFSDRSMQLCDTQAELRTTETLLLTYENALLEVLDAVRGYLPPDGISLSEAMNRIIGAVDNPTINPIINDAEAMRAKRKRDRDMKRAKATGQSVVQSDNGGGV